MKLSKPKRIVGDRSQRRVTIGMESLEERQMLTTVGPLPYLAYPSGTVAVGQNSPSQSFPPPRGPKLNHVDPASPVLSASLAQSSYSANVSDPLTFIGSPQTAQSGLTYTWDFGDGSRTVVGVDLKKPSHVFNSPGTFTVKLTLTNATGTSGVPATASSNIGITPIPELARWQSQMLSYGRSDANTLAQVRAGAAPSTLLGQTYYDAERVFLQIANYTKDPSWLVAEQDAKTIYRDNYLVPNSGGLPGYWLFAKGQEMDYQQTGDPASKNAVMLLAQNGAYSSDSTPPDWTSSTITSREVAYNIMSELAAEDLGAPRRDRTNLLVDQALGQIDQWFVSKTAPFMQPFMVGLTSEALIDWYDKTGDPRVLPALKTAMNGVWNTTWDTASNSFVYVDRTCSEGSRTPAPDLNLLIAPAFAWIYHQTGDTSFRDRGDQAFAGGVDGAWLADGKHFDQNYKWSFDYVNWRSQAPLTSLPANPPKLIDNGPQSGSEGSAVILPLGTMTDINAADGPWTLQVNWGDGSSASPLPVASTGQLPTLSHVYADNGAYSVTESLVGSSGQVLGSRIVAVSVANVAPTASISQGPYSTITGLPLMLNGLASDVSSVDTRAGLTYSWNFGDGSPAVKGVGLQTPSHAFTSTGTFVVTLTATDKDGGVSTPSSVTVNVTNAVVPELARWQAQMISMGRLWASSLAQTNSSFVLTDFDAIKLYYNLADYTGDSSWLTAAANAKAAYRDRYVLPNWGGVSLGWDYTGGLTLDAQRTGDAQSLNAVTWLNQKAAYAADGTPLSYTQDAGRAIAVAQGMMSYMDTEALGAPHKARLDNLATQALGDLDQWFVSKTAQASDLGSMSQVFQALIRYQAKTGDARILPALQNAADWLWNNSWSVANQAFRPIDQTAPGGFGASSSVSNLSIAPLYAWVYSQTGKTAYRDQGDIAFGSGVRNADLTNSSRDFNMAYSWSFDYVKWRIQMSQTTQTNQSGV